MLKISRSNTPRREGNREKTKKSRKKGRDRVNKKEDVVETERKRVEEQMVGCVYS